MKGSRRARELRLLLNLQPHPEGGWFTEHYRAEGRVSLDGLEGDRAAATAIYFMLEEGDVSRPTASAATRPGTSTKVPPWN